MPTLRVIGLFATFMIIIGVGAYLFWFFMKHDITVVIFSDRGSNTLKVFTDRGRYVRDRSGIATNFRLLMMRKNIPPPAYEFLHPAKRGNVLFVRQLSEDEFAPIDVQLSNMVVNREVKDEDGNLILDENGNPQIESFELPMEAISSDAKMFMVSSFRDTRHVYGDQPFLQQYWPLISVLIVGALIIVMIFVVLDNISNLAPALNNVAKALQSTASAVHGAGTTPY